MTLALGIALTAMMTIGAASAHASTSMSCAFQGSIAVTGVPLIGGAGGYSLETAPPVGVACAGASSTPAAAGPFAVLAGRLSSSGTYFNTVCGALGRFETSGSSTVLTPSAALGPSPSLLSADYVLHYVAGQGDLIISSATLSNGDTVSGGGWASMTPTAPLPPALACSPATPLSFEVAGFFTVAG